MRLEESSLQNREGSKGFGTNFGFLHRKPTEKLLTCVVIWVDIGRSNRIARLVAETNVARVQHLVELILKPGYRGKHEEMLTRSCDELRGPKIRKNENLK